MSADPIERLRAARPPTISWADTVAGRDTWDETEGRGRDADFRVAAPGGSRGRSPRWLALTVGALVLVGATVLATVAVTGRSLRPVAASLVTDQARTGRMPASASGASEDHRPLGNAAGGTLLHPGWLPDGFVLVRQSAGQAGSTWSRTWAAPGSSVSADAADRCRSDSLDITVVQGVGVEVPAVGVARLAVEPVVDGVPATVVRTDDNGLSLAWTPLDLPRAGGVSVSTSGRCSGDPITSLGILLRVARGLS